MIDDVQEVKEALWAPIKNFTKNVKLMSMVSETKRTIISILRNMLG